MPMFASVQARWKAPNEAVVGRPIRELSQSRCVRKAVNAMNNKGSTPDAQSSPSPATNGHGCRMRSLRRGGAGAPATSTAALMSVPLPRQDPDLEHADGEDDQHERDADGGRVAHVLVREGLLVDVELGHVGVLAGAAV